MSEGDLSRLNKDLDSLRSRGVALPRHPVRAASTANSMMNASRDAYREIEGLRGSTGRRVNGGSPQEETIRQESESLAKAMGDKRALSARIHRQGSIGAGGGTGVGGDVYNAIPRFYDPLEYWDLSGIPWNVADEGHRHKLHKWLRLYYATHYLVPILVDIFTRFPLVGMEFESKDPKLKEFYEDLFFDQLHYDEFLVSLGREFWVCGEAFPLGSFDEDLGVWEREELLNPEDVVVENFPLLGTQQLKINPPDYLKKLAQQKDPAREYRQLEINFPELIPYLLKGERIPISDVLLRQVANKHNDWDDHGTPILLRGLRTLLHEEKLLASQDAIAERLYSPLILAKLGIMDMGDGMPPFIPGPEELEAVRDDFDIALSSDFRLMVHHFGLDVSSVFGREQMPRLGDDFDRVERRLMQVFGVNPSLLSAGAATQPYASSALQAEFLNQILKTFQNTLIQHYRQRALVVAEAQGHYEYITKGKTRIKVFETIVEYDEEGNKSFKEVPKLLIPDLKFATLDLRDEATERQFLQSLRQMGVPIPDQDLMVGVSWKIQDKIATYNEELKTKTIEQQQAKFDTYTALVAKGLPVPMDLKAEVESVLMGGPQGGGGASSLGAPPTGPGGAPPGAGPGGGIVMPPPPAGFLGPGGVGGTPPGGGPPPATPTSPGPPGSVPDVSNERRPGLTYNTRTNLPEALASLLDKQPDLGVPFIDYVNASVDDDLTEEALDTLLEAWPKHAAVYQKAVAAEITKIAEELLETEDEVTVNDEEELPINYEHKDAEGDLPDRILVNQAKKRVVTKVADEKKYRMLDPDATPPEVEEEQE